jgi:hypothetical protein
MTTTVVNKRDPAYTRQPNDVYVGVYACVPARYDIAELQGKRLVCFCKPLRCHGDWLAEQANNGEAADDGV